MSNFHDEVEEPLLNNLPNESVSRVASATKGGKVDRYRALARLAGCCVSAASSGWHDGCIGALIPYLQIYYGDMSDEKISLVFICSFTGYTLASLMNATLSSRVGLGRLIIIGATLQGIASAMIALRLPLIAMAVCYTIAGFGLALQDAQFNTYVARLPGAATKLGIVHATYGVGALLSPAAATLLMQAKVPPPLFYLTNLVWCAATVSTLLVGFGFSKNGPSDGNSQSSVGSNEGVASLKTIISSRAVWAALLFISLYTGSETSEAGWVVSFLMRKRDGGTMSGYASTAFYGGLTSSRVVLLPLTAWLTEKSAVTLYCTVALVMQVIVWSSHSFIVNLVAIAACGFVMGPVYPITLALVTKATPRGYHSGAIGLMACFGQSGSAFVPFLVGTLAEKYSIGVLQPILVSLFVVMILLWQLVPSPKVPSSPGPKSPSIRED